MNNCNDILKFPKVVLSELLLLHKKHEINKFVSDCVVFFETDDLVKIAIHDENDVCLIDFLHNFFKTKKVEIFLSEKQEIDFFNFKSDVENETINLANNYIILGIRENASDIHFKVEKDNVKIYFRINGDLKFKNIIQKEKWNNIKRRYKVISNLNIADEINPQSGAANIFYVDKCCYIRVSTHPGIFGENITIRIQENNYDELNVETLGFDADVVDSIRKSIKYQKGLFILSGPVGVGKTTTIYSILKEISNKNIMTIEDPVEIIVPEFKQMDINENSKLTYDECIKSSLRHDPDVLLIGEIRDTETANAAIRASLTGKLVFTTIHAFDAFEALSRLVDLKLDINYLVQNINTVMSQRLFFDKNSNKRFAVGEIINFLNVPNYIKFETISELKKYIPKYKTMREKADRLVLDNVIDKEEITKILGD